VTLSHQSELEDEKAKDESLKKESLDDIDHDESDEANENNDETNDEVTTKAKELQDLLEEVDVCIVLLLL